MKQIFKSFICVLGLLSSTVTVTAQATNIQQEINEMSYALGLTQTQGMDEYLTNRLKIDLTYKDSFIKGVLEGAERGNAPESAAYYAGIQIGVQICTQMMKEINKELFGEKCKR